MKLISLLLHNFKGARAAEPKPNPLVADLIAAGVEPTPANVEAYERFLANRPPRTFLVEQTGGEWDERLVVELPEREARDPRNGRIREEVVR